MDKMKLESYAQTAYRKCDNCKWVRDIFFRLNNYDAESGQTLVGSLELCKECGQNFGELLGQPAETEHTLREFTFA